MGDDKELMEVLDTRDKFICSLGSFWIFSYAYATLYGCGSRQVRIATFETEKREADFRISFRMTRESFHFLTEKCGIRLVGDEIMGSLHYDAIQC